MALSDDVDHAFGDARRRWRQRWAPFAGVPRIDPWTSGVEFAFERSYVDSYVNYERAVTRELRRIQLHRWLHHGAGQAIEAAVAEARDADRRAPDRLRSLPLRQRRRLRRAEPWVSDLRIAYQTLLRHEDQGIALERLQMLLTEEIYAVREAVDAELSEGRGRRCVVDAIRRPPSRPAGVQEFRDVDAFVASDRRRAMPGWPDEHDAGGSDHGSFWRLENPLRRWDTSRWRLSWLNMHHPTYELYAIEQTQRRRDDAGVLRTTGRVWLLGALDDRGRVDETIGEIQQHAQRERNSLVVLAEAVSRTANQRSRR